MPIHFDEKYILDLIAEGEHQQLDFKFEISDARKIARTLVAFANTDGGRLLIGVKDNGRISGVKSEEEYYMIEAAATMYCKPALPFNSYKRAVEGKTILEIVIKPSDNKPFLAIDDNNRWKAYHRVNDNNYLADYILFNVWKRESRKKGTFIKYTENEKALLNYLNEHENVTFDAIKQSFQWNKRMLQNILVNLIVIKVVSMTFDENEPVFNIQAK